VITRSVDEETKRLRKQIVVDGTFAKLKRVLQMSAPMGAARVVLVMSRR